MPLHFKTWTCIHIRRHASDTLDSGRINAKLVKAIRFGRNQVKSSHKSIKVICIRTIQFPGLPLSHANAPGSSCICACGQYCYSQALHSQTRQAFLQITCNKYHFLTSRNHWRHQRLHRIQQEISNVERGPGNDNQEGKR